MNRSRRDAAYDSPVHREYQVIVIGGGHAGCEAAVASARMGLKTALFTLSVELIAQMSCNPAVGGIAIGEACDAVDAVVIATEWPEFAMIDLRALRRVTRGDLLFDGRSVISPASAKAAGFRYTGPAGIADGTINAAGLARPRLGTAA